METTSDEVREYYVYIAPNQLPSTQHSTIARIYLFYGSQQKLPFTHKVSQHALKSSHHFPFHLHCQSFQNPNTPSKSSLDRYEYITKYFRGACRPPQVCLTCPCLHRCSKGHSVTRSMSQHKRCIGLRPWSRNIDARAQRGLLHTGCVTRDSFNVKKVRYSCCRFGSVGFELHRGHHNN